MSFVPSVVKKLNHGEHREHKALKIEWGKEQNGNLLALCSISRLLGASQATQRTAIVRLRKMKAGTERSEMTDFLGITISREDIGDS